MLIENTRKGTNHETKLIWWCYFRVFKRLTSLLQPWKVRFWTDHIIICLFIRFKTAKIKFHNPRIKPLRKLEFFIQSFLLKLTCLVNFSHAVFSKIISQILPYYVIYSQNTTEEPRHFFSDCGLQTFRTLLIIIIFFTVKFLKTKLLSKN